MVRYTAFLLGALALSACSVIPGGASVGSQDEEDGSSTVADVHVAEVQFTLAPGPKDIDGVAARITPVNSVPVLYYRYQVQGGVNGHYLLMPAPPKLYTVTKVPFFQTDPDHVTLQISLDNSSTRLFDTGTAVCAFDLDGHTLAVAPLEHQTLLPGHSANLRVTGPAIADLQRTSAGTLVVWLYGLSGADAKQAYRWDMPFHVVQSSQRIESGATMQTRSKHVADSYENRVDRASSVAN